jgi:CHAD domain-containing protein
LRTVLRELTDLGGTIDPTWEPALAEAFGALGVRRDAEVVADAVEPLLQAARAPLTRWTPPADVDIAAVVRASEFQLTLVNLLGWLHGGDAGLSPLGPREARECIGGRLQRLHRRITKAGRRFAELPLEEQHRVRKRLKRLRYLAELVQTLWDGDDARRYLAHLKPAQDALGHHNDVATAAAAFQAETSRNPRAWSAAGFLQAHLAVTARTAHKSLREIAQAKPFWRG